MITYTDEIRDITPQRWESENKVVEKPLRFGKNFHELQKAIKESDSQNPPVIFNSRRGQYCVIVGEQGSAKTTLTLWIALSMACGKPYEPFYKVGKPQRIYIFDGEATQDELLNDLAEFRHHFNAQELQLIDANLRWACQEMVGEEMLQLSNKEHLSLIETDLKEFKPDLIIADNLSSLFAGLSESDNRSMNDFEFCRCVNLAGKLMLPCV